MWRLQHKNARKWSRSLSASLGVHCLIAFLFLRMCTRCVEQIRIAIDARLLNAQAPVIFANPAAPPSSQPKIAPQQKKVPSPPARKAVAQKPVPQKKPGVTLQNNAQKSVQQKVMPPAKPIEPKKELPKAPPIKKVAPVNTAPKPTPPKIVEAPKKEEPALITASDVVEIERYAHISLEEMTRLHRIIAEHWHPPIASYEGAQCTIEAFVSQSGMVDKVSVAASSGILMFDIAARGALHGVRMPTWTHGKSLLITFK